MNEIVTHNQPVTSDTRSRLQAAALELFAERGVSNTPITVIAKRAGVSQGLMYRYFDSKDALVRAIFTAALEQLDALRQKHRSLEPLLRASFSRVREGRFWTQFYSLRNQPEVRALLAEDIVDWQDGIICDIAALCESLGFLQPNIEAHILFATIDGIAQHLVNDPEYPLELVIQRLLERYRSSEVNT